MAQQYTGKCQCGAVNYSLLSSLKQHTHAIVLIVKNVPGVRLGYQ